MAPYYGLPLKYCDAGDTTNEPNTPETTMTPQNDNESMEEVKNISEKVEENIEEARDIDIENIFKQNITPSVGGFELSALSANVFPDIGSPTAEKCFKTNIKTKVFRGIPAEKFVWNSYILEGLRAHVHPDWLLNIIHGFVGQSSIFSNYF